MAGALAAMPWAWFLLRDLHPWLDVLALGLPVVVLAVAGAAVAVTVLRGRWSPGMIAASWLVFGAMAVVGPWLPQGGRDPVDGVRIVAANVRADGSDPSVVGAEILDQDPDIVVVSERTDGHEDVLSQRFPDVLRSAARGTQFDVGVFTDLPVEDMGMPPGISDEGGVRIRVEGPEGPFVLYALHLPPPRLLPSSHPEVSVRRHTEIVSALHAAIAGERLPVVVAGDLNLVDRASGYRRLTGVLDDAVRAGWARPTSLKPVAVPLLARVDHILAPEGWCSGGATIFSLTGSDHRGVAATVGACQQQSAERPGRQPLRAATSLDRLVK